MAKVSLFVYVCVENTNVPEHLWHGDMIGNPGRAGHKLRKWPNGIVHYIYDRSIGELDYVHWPGHQLAKTKNIIMLDREAVLVVSLFISLLTVFSFAPSKKI